MLLQGRTIFNSFCPVCFQQLAAIRSFTQHFCAAFRTDAITALTHIVTLAGFHATALPGLKFIAS
jgi:hypothetical protein